MLDAAATYNTQLLLLHCLIHWVALEKVPVQLFTDTITSHGNKVVFCMFLMLAWVTVAVFFTYLTSVLPGQLRAAIESWRFDAGT